MIAFRGLLLVLACMALPAAVHGRPVKSSAATISSIKQAIEKGDASAFAKIDDRLEYLPRDRSQMMQSSEAFQMLRGCQYRSESVLGNDTILIHYECSARAAKLNCTTGNLRVMAYDDNAKTEMTLAEEPIYVGDCPKISVPRAPAVFELNIANQVARMLIDGPNPNATNMLTNDVQIARSARFATGSPQLEFQGSGLSALIQQNEELIAKVGKPIDVTCDAAESICRYKFDSDDKFLFAGIATRDHKVETVHFFYSTLTMIQRTLGPICDINDVLAKCY